MTIIWVMGGIAIGGAILSVVTVAFVLRPAGSQVLQRNTYLLRRQIIVRGIKHPRLLGIHLGPIIVWVRRGR